MLRATTTFWMSPVRWCGLGRRRLAPASLGCLPKPQTPRGRPPAASFASSSSSASTPRVAAGVAGIAGLSAALYAGAVATGLVPTPFDDADAPAPTALAPVAEASVTDRVFFDVSIGNDDAPTRVVIALYGVECPRTVANFRTLCASTSAAMGYRGVSFHRIIPGFMIQGGDITRGDGTGGTSIYGGAFADEALHAHRHAGAGVVSMANRGPNTNTSQFFITLKKCPHLDGRHVVFGRVIQGFEVIERAANEAGTRSGRPTKRVRVVDCGVLERTKEEALRAIESGSGAKPTTKAQ